MKVSRPNSTLKVDTEKGLRQGKPLERRTELRRTEFASDANSRPVRSSLGRSSFTPAKGYDYAAFVQGIADRDGADCWVRRNVPMEPALLACDGQLDGHHVLPKQWLKREFPRGWSFPEDAYSVEPPPTYSVGLDRILSDPRNGILVCRKHHDLIEGSRISLSAESLPGCVFEFAGELGDRAVARLERQFGPAPGGAK